MPQRTDTFDLASLGLSSGEGRRLDLYAHIDPFDYAGSRYAVPEEYVPVRVDVSRTMGEGWVLRLRFAARLEGPCMRCLEVATPAFEVDSYEVHQPGAGDEDLKSPYMLEDGLDLMGWARDALALALPTQIKCGDDCAGLCPRCGANLNEEPDHAHAPEPDARWGKLSELKFE
jgi:uncharacterized protein